MALLRRRSSLGTAHARLDQIILLERALRKDARSFARRELRHVLADLGSALGNGGAHALGLVPSEPAVRVARLLRVALVAAGSLDETMALAITSLEGRTYSRPCPSWQPRPSRSGRHQTCAPSRATSPIYVRASAIMIIPGVVYLASVLWGQRITFLHANCFVDKMCIHQTDLRLKEHAIKSFDLFLRFSRRMVVLCRRRTFSGFGAPTNSRRSPASTTTRRRASTL